MMLSIDPYVFGATRYQTGFSGSLSRSTTKPSMENTKHHHSDAKALGRCRCDRSKQCKCDESPAINERRPSTNVTLAQCCIAMTINVCAGVCMLHLRTRV